MSMDQLDNILGIITTDKDGTIKSVSYGNGDLDCNINGSRLFYAFSKAKEECLDVKGEYPKVFRLPEIEQEVSVSVSYGKRGGVTGFHILVEKTNDKEDSECSLNKLQCLGRITPGIAHEIINPLTYVSGCLQMFHLETHDADPNKKTYARLIKEFDRISRLVNGLFGFAKQTPISKKVFDINRVIEDVILMVGYTMKNEDIGIVKDLLSSELNIYGDSNRLEQVFLNLFQNARESMPDGGEICLNTDLLQKDNSVVIRFSDTGCGVTNDQLSKIFCHSYTTKQNGNGAGLGLSVCKTIINEFNGTIDFDSEVGKGAVVTMILPLYSYN